jgi:hypothetical protein
LIKNIENLSTRKPETPALQPNFKVSTLTKTYPHPRTFLLNATNEFLCAQLAGGLVISAID